MISPSTTHRSGRYDRTASTTSGKYRCIGLVFRDPISTESPSRNTIARNPSHLGSYSLPGGIDAADLESMGSTGGITGSVMDTESYQPPPPPPPTPPPENPPPQNPDPPEVPGVGAEIDSVAIEVNRSIDDANADAQ